MSHGVAARKKGRKENVEIKGKGWAKRSNQQKRGNVCERNEGRDRQRSRSVITRRKLKVGRERDRKKALLLLLEAIVVHNGLMVWCLSFSFCFIDRLVCFPASSPPPPSSRRCRLGGRRRRGAGSPWRGG